MPPLILLAIYGLSTPKTANGAPYARRSWASTYASIESVLESFPMPRAKSRTCRGFTTATGRPAAPSSATSAASRPPVASMTITKGVRFWSRLTRPSILFASVVHVNDVSSGSTWTSNFSWLTSIPTKISLGTCDIPHLWIRTPMGPGDCSGFIHEDIRRSSCWTLSNKPVPIDQPGLPSRSLQGTGQPCTPPITGCTRRSNPEYSLPKKYRLPDPYCQSSPQADVRGRGEGSSSNNIQVPPGPSVVLRMPTTRLHVNGFLRKVSGPRHFCAKNIQCSSCQAPCFHSHPDCIRTCSQLTELRRSRFLFPLRGEGKRNLPSSSCRHRTRSSCPNAHTTQKFLRGAGRFFQKELRILHLFIFLEPLRTATTANHYSTALP